MGDTGIFITTRACPSGVGTAFCENWDLQFTKLGEYKILITALGASLPVSDHAFKATVTAPDTRYRVSIGDASVTEGQAGENPMMTFEISLDRPNTEFIQLDYATSPGSATEGVDYNGVNNARLIIPVAPLGTNPTSIVNITIPINGDNDIEGNEDFTLVLSNLSSNAVFANNSATGTIIDDEVPRLDQNTLVQTWPLDTFLPLGTTTAFLALSPKEAQFVGVAFLAGPFDIRWTIESTSPDPRNACAPCPGPSITPGQANLSLRYPDGATLQPDLSQGLSLGSWIIRTQIYNTDTGLDHQGFDEFTLIVDPGAFQLIPGSNWQDMTLSLFGDMPGASTTSAVGSCSAGQFEWELSVFLAGTSVDKRCVDLSTLTSGGTTDWVLTGLAEGNYTATLRYVDGTPANLGAMFFERHFEIVKPLE